MEPLPPAPWGEQQVEEAGIIDRTLRSLPVFIVHQENKITPISNRNITFSVKVCKRFTEVGSEQLFHKCVKNAIKMQILYVKFRQKQDSHNEVKYILRPNLFNGKLDIYPHLFFQLNSDSCFDLSTLAGTFIWPRQRRHLWKYFEKIYGPILTFLKPLKYIVLTLFLLLLLCLRIIISLLSGGFRSLILKLVCMFIITKPNQPLNIDPMFEDRILRN